jgi:hypothetical protein
MFESLGVRAAIQAEPTSENASEPGLQAFAVDKTIK